MALQGWKEVAVLSKTNSGTGSVLLKDKVKCRNEGERFVFPMLWSPVHISEEKHLVSDRQIPRSDYRLGQ